MRLESPTPHGFSLSPSDTVLLRGRPPVRALAWAASAVGRSGRVCDVRPLPGGTSSAVHALTIAVDGRVHDVVLRRYVRADWLAAEPDLAEREAEALELLAASSVPHHG